MSDWRALVQDALRPKDNRDKRDASSDFGPIVPSVPPLDPVRALKLCDKGLATLDPAKPLHGLEPARWRRLLEDAQWLRDAYAPAAFRNGWTPGELFGLWFWMDGDTLTLKPAWGGLADRLQGARSLVMTEDRATWRIMFSGAPDQFARTTYPALPLMWEPQP
jgi:hypothetical protein